MDFIRWGHEAEMTFSPDGALKSKVRWYRCPDGALDIGVPTPFVSAIWDDFTLFTNVLGEQKYQEPFKPTNPKTPPTADGQHRCGTDEQWTHGFPVGTFSGITYDGYGIPGCCGRFWWFRGGIKFGGRAGVATTRRVAGGIRFGGGAGVGGRLVLDGGLLFGGGALLPVDSGGLLFGGGALLPEPSGGILFGGGA